MSYSVYSLIVLISIIFSINWLAKNGFLNNQSARKLTHTITGIVACTFPLFLSSLQIVILSVIFVLFMTLAKLGKMLVLNNVERTTWGEVYFPAGVGISAFLALPQNVNAYFVGILCLTIADTIANIVGNLLPLKVIKIGNQKKSLGGLIACIIMTSIIFALFFPLLGSSWYLILLAAIIVGFVEVISIYGIDNLTVPVIATILSLMLNECIKM